MNPRLLLWLFILQCIIVGCASTSDTQSWIGRTEADLMAAWGTPEEIIPNENGSRTLVYTRTDPYSSRGGSDVYRYGSGTRDADVPGGKTKWQRQYMFRVNTEGIVYDSSVRKQEVRSPE